MGGGSASGELRVRFGSAAFGELAAAGFFGLLPVVSWLERLAPSLKLGPFSVALLLLACPALPCLVLWLRQPRAVTVGWDEAGVWAHCAGRVLAHVPWERATMRGRSGRAARVALWRSASSRAALQLVDGESGDAITVVDGMPEDAPPVRRRLLVPTLGPLVEAAKTRGLAPSGEIDWRLAGARTRSFAVRAAWLGYPLVMFGLMRTEAPPDVSRGVALIGAAALALRASPSARELASIVRARAALAPQAHAAPAGSLYRAPPRERPAPRGAPVTGYGVALELAVRLAFVACSVVGALLPARG